MRCANCDSEIPADSKFCIECGAPAAQAATGATERLPDYAGGPECAACGTRNPPNAAFCVNCGRSFDARPAAVAPPVNPPALAPEPAPLSHTPLASVETGPVARPRRARSGVEWGGITGGLFLLGIAVLAVTGWWWPGILVVIGCTSLISGLVSGTGSAPRWAGLQGALFMFGLAVIAQFGWWWPGILVLVGLSAILGAVARNDKAI